MEKEKSRRLAKKFECFEVFPWNENFETGNKIIDQQHKKLVLLLNKLGRTLINEESIEVNLAFDELAKYADFHFHEEEAIWANHFADDYWLSSHQMSHASFLPKVIEIKKQEVGKKLSNVIEEIVQFLIRWLAFHIIDSDKRMAIAISEIEKGTPINEAKLLAEKKMSGSMRMLIETILKMYDGLSSNAIDLMRERKARIKAEDKLKKVNRKLEALSVTDQLTELYNRRFFNTTFEREIRAANREGKTLSFFMIDIDFFKLYNDNYGHLEGDEVLKSVSQALRQICRRPTDFVFRFGGEEFGVITSGMPHDYVEKFGEKLRFAVEDLQIPHSHNNASDYVTISIGAVNLIPSRNDTMESIIKIADDRLYYAKDTGRNRVVVEG